VAWETHARAGGLAVGWVGDRTQRHVSAVLRKGRSRDDNTSTLAGSESTDAGDRAGMHGLGASPGASARATVSDADAAGFPSAPPTPGPVAVRLLAVSDGRLVAKTPSTTMGAVEGAPPAEPTDDSERANDDRKQIRENKGVVAVHVEDEGPFEGLVDLEPHDAQQQERCYPPDIPFPAPPQRDEHGRRQREADCEVQHAPRVGRDPIPFGSIVTPTGQSYRISSSRGRAPGQRHAWTFTS
jgi:hypothetical protein